MLGQNLFEVENHPAFLGVPCLLQCVLYDLISQAPGVGGGLSSSVSGSCSDMREDRGWESSIGAETFSLFQGSPTQTMASCQQETLLGQGLH